MRLPKIFTLWDLLCILFTSSILRIIWSTYWSFWGLHLMHIPHVPESQIFKIVPNCNLLHLSYLIVVYQQSFKAHDHEPLVTMVTGPLTHKYILSYLQILFSLCMFMILSWWCVFSSVHSFEHADILKIALVRKMEPSSFVKIQMHLIMKNGRAD